MPDVLDLPDYAIRCRTCGALHRCLSTPSRLTLEEVTAWVLAGVQLVVVAGCPTCDPAGYRCTGAP